MASCLLGAVIDIPCFLKLNEQSIYLKIIWRYIAIIVLLIPILTLDFLIDPYKLLKLILKDAFKVFILSMLHIAYIYLIYFSAENTLIIYTMLLCSMSTIFSTTWKIIRGIYFTRIEYIGLGISLIGAYFCCCETPLNNSIFI